MDKLWYFTVSKRRKNYTHSHTLVKMCRSVCKQKRIINSQLICKLLSHFPHYLSPYLTTHSLKRRKTKATNSSSQSEQTNTHILVAFSLSLGHAFFGFILDNRSSNTRKLHSAAHTFVFVFEFGACQPTGSDLSGSLCVSWSCFEFDCART